MGAGGGTLTGDNKIVVFQDIQIRKIWHNDEWYFSVVDIVKALTDSPNPRQYWGKVKDRAFKALELSPIWVRLKLPAEDSKMRFTDCANNESAFRLIQSIPSRKAEPFKRWLAHVGSERIYKMTKMTENPFHCTETLKPAPHLEQINYNLWAQLEFKHELTGA